MVAEDCEGKRCPVGALGDTVLYHQSDIRARHWGELREEKCWYLSEDSIPEREPGDAEAPRQGCALVDTQGYHENAHHLRAVCSRVCKDRRRQKSQGS